jgi:hypothetical protein
MPNNLMRKSTLIATCLLNSKFITDMAFGEQKVKEIFTHMRPKADFDKWNTTKNKAKKEAMTYEMWKMKKLDIKKLKAAFDNA